MRGFYVLRPSESTHDHVRHAYNVGAIDTVLYAVDASPLDSPWLDGHEFGVETLCRYRRFGVRTYPVIDWQERGLGPDDPRNHVEERIAHALGIVCESGVEGIVWDTEDYRAQQGDGFQQPVPRDFASMCQAAGLNVIGAMPKPMRDVWFCEDTYEKNRWWKVKLEGLGEDIIPGAWVEMHADPARYVRKLKRCYKGFWVYSHVLFGQRMIKPLWDKYVSKEQLPLTWWESL